ncbi:MAG TPA: hypothetical protein P5513_07685 [Candidatus Diapherotrites archaeon]|nr:hypothetical protein [Candidatus Diapherotrites archaeon]
MKRNIIFLLVLIAFFAIPALAGTPKPENAPAPTSEDTMFLGWQLLSDEELIAIQGNRTIIEDAYYHGIAVPNPNENGEYSNSGWEDMILLYDGNGHLYGIMDYNGNVFTDFNHDGQITQADVFLTLVHQGYDKWSASKYSGMLFGAQNPPATPY